MARCLFQALSEHRVSPQSVLPETNERPTVRQHLLREYTSLVIQSDPHFQALSLPCSPPPSRRGPLSGELSAVVCCGFIFLFFPFFGLCFVACRIRPTPLAVKVRSPNHWTTREFPPQWFCCSGLLALRIRSPEISPYIWCARLFFLTSGLKFSFLRTYLSS